MQKGYWQIYTGDGKGKTTAALGLAVRACGCGLKVCMIQFLKHGDCGEHRAMQKLGVTIDAQGAPQAPPWDKNALASWESQTKAQWDKAKKAAQAGYGLLILDELLGAMHKGFIAEADIIEMATGRNPGCELVITGRNATPALIEAADLVTHMQPVKHYMDAGVAARAGVEY